MNSAGDFIRRIFLPRLCVWNPNCEPEESEISQISARLRRKKQDLRTLNPNENREQRRQKPRGILLIGDPDAEGFL